LQSLITPDIYIALALIQLVVFLLLIRFLDLYEREPLSVLAIMAVWGAIGASVLSTAGNEAVASVLSPEVRAVFGSAISGPLVEECAKGLALVAAFGLSHWALKRFGFLEFEGITDGVVYGAAVGLGFAFTEDLLYLFDYISAVGPETGLDEYLKRVDFLGIGQLGHAVYTGTFGVGLGLATWSRGWAARVGFSVLGLMAAVFMHAVHNGLANLVLVLRYGLEAAAAWRGDLGYVSAGLAKEMQDTVDDASAVTTVVDYALVATFFTAIFLWLWYQRRIICNELADEAGSGLISLEEWEVMPRYWSRSKQYWGLLWAGKPEHWRQLKRIHGELVDLAFLKWRLRKVGGDWGHVESRRQRIASLKSQRVVE
jgi:RsiW-degrading membrane proteinase PrsW (M82 family)